MPAEPAITPSTPIAIVGLACRFPGGEDADAFWRLLARGGDAVTDIPPARLDIDRWYHPDPDRPGTICTRRGAFLADIEHFDPTFFGIPPRAAAGIDPQQRLVLEVGWHALEHAGIPPDGLRNRPVGVFVGISELDYARRVFADPARIDLYSGSGNMQAFAAGRLAHALGVVGPAEAIDTVCSSSLVALHRACVSLAIGECELALTGGTHVMLGPEGWILLTRAKALSPDGRSKAFAATANGFVRGEGCGMLVLKRLADAERDGDRVLAVIRGSAVNNDGPSAGLTVPNVAAQVRLLRTALARAGLQAADLDYLEAHGTGTALGDPIEVRAAAEALGGERPADRPLLLGSVKSNIGHLEPAAGVAGVIKTVLAMQQGLIPAHLYCTEPNPRIPWEQLPFRVATEATPWPRSRRIAGVSSFGMSGTNAHVLLEGGEALAPPGPPPATPPAAAVLPLSARNGAALGRLAAAWSRWLDAHPQASLADLCATAALGRAHFGHRAALAGDSAAMLKPRLDQLARDAAADHARPSRPPRIAFLFTGQGSQYPSMARGLYETWPVFRATIDHCSEVLGEGLGVPLADLLLDPRAGERIDDTRYAQPALFAFELALAALWRSLGIEPTAVLGHSLGEYSAACAAGVLDLDDGLRLVASRGALMGTLPAGGAMAAVFAAPEAVAAAIAGSGLEIAADNGAHQVISGPAAALERVLAALDADGVSTRRLATSHAFHSALLEPMLGDLEAVAARIAHRPPQCTLIRNLDGRPFADGAAPDAGYWRRHSREPVRFAASVAALAETDCDLVLEIGPQAVLCGMLARAWPGTRAAPRMIASWRRDRPDALAAAAADLYAAGADIDWAVWLGERPFRRLGAPLYPFARERYWIEDAGGAAAAPTAAATADAPGGGPPALYRVAWEPVALPAAAAATSAAAVAGWCVLGGGRLAGAISLPVVPDAAALAARLDAGEPAPTRVLVDATDPAPSHADPADPAAALPQQAHAATAAALRDLKGLLADERLGATALVWVSAGAIAAAPGDGPADLAHAPLWGLLRSARNEHEGRTLRSVDLGAPATWPAPPMLTALLAADAEPELAWRGGRALAPQLRAAAPAGGASPRRSPAGPLDPARPVLITGGFGGLGRALARHLVQRHGARALILTSRRGAASPGADELVSELADLGARVTAVACDIADRAQVDALIAAHRPGGIFHLAGILDDGLLDGLDEARLARVLRPKLDGAWHLHQATPTSAPTTFVLFSSIAGLLGARGQAAYAAGNAFLDALAAARRAAGQPALSLSWGLWNGAGMGAALGAADRARIGRDGVAALDVEDALALLDDALGRPEAHLVPLRAAAGGPPRAARRGAPAAAPAAAAVPVPGRARATAGDAAGCCRPHGAGLAALSPAERLSAARRLVAGAVATVLGHADAAALDPQAGFTDLGLDSLMAVELRNALQVETGLKLPATVTFEHPSIERLAHCVADRAAQSSAAPVLPEPPGADPAAPGAAAAAAWSDAAVRRKLAQVSIDALRDSGLLAQLMQQPDALPAATAAGASPAAAAQGSDGDDADILQALEAELGLGDER